MENSISHSLSDATLAAKIRWFRALSIEERMQIFCEFMDLIIEVNPTILEKKDAQSIPGRIQVLSKK